MLVVHGTFQTPSHPLQALNDGLMNPGVTKTEKWSQLVSALKDRLCNTAHYESVGTTVPVRQVESTTEVYTGQRAHGVLWQD